jgi:ABC-2 type transport system ATP-binding protein
MSQKSRSTSTCRCARTCALGGAYGLSGKALRERSPRLLRLTELTDREDALTGSLPGGIRQRLALGCAILHRPEIVFLDEPTPRGPGRAPLVLAAHPRAGARRHHRLRHHHYLDEAEYCARIGLMVDGRMVALDTPSALKRAFVPDRLFVVRGPDAAPPRRDRRQARVRAVTPFGPASTCAPSPGRGTPCACPSWRTPAGRRCRGGRRRALAGGRLPGGSSARAARR